MVNDHMACVNVLKEYTLCVLCIVCTCAMLACLFGA